MNNPTKIEIRQTSDSVRAILFVHGFSGDSEHTFGLLPAFVAGDHELSDWDIYSLSYPSSLSPDISGVWRADPNLTELSHYLRENLTDTFGRYSKIALIAHSMGGLLVQRGVLDLENRDRVSHILLFGTPSEGLRKAKLGTILFKRQVKDMRPESEFIVRLKEDREKIFANPAFEFLSVGGLRDEFVPSSSSLAPFDRNYCRRVMGDHLSIVKPERYGSEVTTLVLSRLKGAKIPTPTTVTADDVIRAKDDPEEIVRVAILHELAGYPEDALELLQANLDLNYYIHGALAGRYKRIWLADSDTHETSGKQALDTYAAGYKGALDSRKFKPAIFNGINWAFMELAFNRDANAGREIAAEVAKLLGRPDVDDYYHYYGSLAEAKLHLGKYDEALKNYILQDTPALTRDRRISMFQQAIWTARFLRHESLARQIQGLILGHEVNTEI